MKSTLLMFLSEIYEFIFAILHPSLFNSAPRGGTNDTYMYRPPTSDQTQSFPYSHSIILTMKTAIFASLMASAAAFAPASQSASSSALSAAPKPIGDLPPVGFFGENEWNLLTGEWGSEDTGTFLRAAELKHGRSAMVATLGFLFHEFGWTLNNISPHEYLSVSQGVKFADLAAMTPLEAMQNVPAAGLAQMFTAIAIVELYELTHKDGKWAMDEGGVAPGLKSGGLTGDLGWNPLNFDVTEEIQLKELQNGRAAMVAISAWVFHDAIPGSVPIPLPW